MTREEYEEQLNIEYTDMLNREATIRLKLESLLEQLNDLFEDVDEFLADNPEEYIEISNPDDEDWFVDLPEDEADELYDDFDKLVDISDEITSNINEIQEIRDKLFSIDKVG